MSEEKDYVADEIEGSEKHFYCTAIAKPWLLAARSRQLLDEMQPE